MDASLLFMGALPPFTLTLPPFAGAVLGVRSEPREHPPRAQVRCRPYLVQGLGFGLGFRASRV
eukprot:3930882-Rhodomonas_salina.1